LGGMSISQFRGSLSIINSSATRIVVNPAIPEAVELTCRFASTPRKISLLPIKYDSPQKAHAHLEASKRTIQQLLDMRASNSSDQTKYRCHASVVSIDTSSRWVYLGCSECYCSVTLCEPDFWCATHDRIPPSETKHCFKIRFVVSDETASAHFLLLGKTAENIIPATADDLFRNFPRLDDCLPPELELFLGKEFTFDVQLPRHAYGLEDADFRINNMSGVDLPSRRSQLHTLMSSPRTQASQPVTSERLLP